MTKDFCPLYHYEGHVNTEAKGGKSACRKSVVFILLFGLFFSKDPPARQSFRTSTFLYQESLERKWELYHYVVRYTIEGNGKSQSALPASTIG